VPIVEKTDTFGAFPMIIAAGNGHLEIMKLLFHHGGAQDDIRRLANFRRLASCGTSLLRVAFEHSHDDVFHRLILKRALSSPRDIDVVIDDDTMRRDLRPISEIDNLPILEYDHRLTMLSWAQGAVTNHANIRVF